MIYHCDEKRHLVCVPFSVDNLHKMAYDLGIKRCWYHSGKLKHYDIPKRRIKEIQDKCIIVTSKKIVEIITNKSL
jgi:hypothetical protein